MAKHETTQAEPTSEPADDDPRHVARAEELARQQEVIDAVAAWNSGGAEAAAAEAADADA